MARGSPLRQAIEAIVRDVIADQQQITGSTDPEYGSVILVNDDGTVNVQTSSSIYTEVGSPVQLTIGAQVVVITAQGVQVAVPR